MDRSFAMALTSALLLTPLTTLTNLDRLKCVRAALCHPSGCMRACTRVIARMGFACMRVCACARAWPCVLDAVAALGTHLRCASSCSSPLWRSCCGPQTTKPRLRVTSPRPPSPAPAHARTEIVHVCAGLRNQSSPIRRSDSRLRPGGLRHMRLRQSCRRDARVRPCAHLPSHKSGHARTCAHGTGPP